MKILNQELVDKLIKLYEESIELVKKSKSDYVDNILQGKGVEGGVCAACRINFDINPEDDDFICRHVKTHNFYWCDTPIGHKKEIAIELLQKRLDILKTFKED